jgi:hypothetical protein
VKGFLASLATSCVVLLAGVFPLGSAAAAPPNDNFANAQVVGPALPIAQPATTVGATLETGEEHGPQGHSVWFSWTAPAPGPVRVDACDFKAVSGPANKGLWVYTGGSIPTLVEVATNFNGCKVSFEAVAGTTYRIAFSSFFDGEGNFTLRLFTETPPANDDFSAARLIGPGLPIRVRGSNLFSTVEAGEPHHGSKNETDFKPNDTVWYRWTPAATTEARIRACEATFGARVGVYTGSAVGALTRVTPTEPITGFPFCAIRFEAVQGTPYSIAVGGFGGEEEGEFLLDVHHFQRPANDNFSAAQAIGPQLPISVAGTNLDASVEPGEPGHEPFDDDTPNASVWYSWTPGASLSARISTCGHRLNGALAVYTGDAVDELTEVAVSKEGCGPLRGRRLNLAALAGTRYWIAVDGHFNEERAFRLSVRDTAAVPIPLPPATEKAKPRFSLKRALKKCRKIKQKKPRRRCIRKARRRAKRLNA